MKSFISNFFLNAEPIVLMEAASFLQLFLPEKDIADSRKQLLKTYNSIDSPI